MAFPTKTKDSKAHDHASSLTTTGSLAFSHPDYTVGPGISPDLPPSGSRALPPIGN